MAQVLDDGAHADHGRAAGPFGPRPTIGTSTAAKTVAEDAAELGKALVALAKAEALTGVKAKMAGIGMLAAAGVLLAIASLGLLLTAGFVLAEVAGMPGWGAALTVSGTLIFVSAMLAIVGRRKAATEISIETTKRNVEEAVAWTKQHLTSR